jgi:CO dehydrogenase nickel-insertion accessory protein CooC1
VGIVGGNHRPIQADIVSKSHTVVAALVAEGVVEKGGMDAEDRDSSASTNKLANRVQPLGLVEVMVVGRREDGKNRCYCRMKNSSRHFDISF